MATRLDVYASARWQARQHASEVDALTDEQWSACLARAWHRLWTVHPAAFHVDGELIGEMPVLVETDAAVLLVLPEWLDVLSAGVAADALGAMVIDDPARAAGVAAAGSDCATRFWRGLGAGG